MCLSEFRSVLGMENQQLGMENPQVVSLCPIDAGVRLLGCRGPLLSRLFGCATLRWYSVTTRPSITLPRFCDVRRERQDPNLLLKVVDHSPEQR